MKNADLKKMEWNDWYWYFYIQLFLHISQVAYQFRVRLEYDFTYLEDALVERTKEREQLQKKIDMMLVKDEAKAQDDLWDAREKENEAREKLEWAKENCLPIEFLCRRDESKEKKEWTYVKLFVFDENVVFKIVWLRGEIHNYNLSIEPEKTDLEKNDKKSE